MAKLKTYFIISVITQNDRQSRQNYKLLRMRRILYIAPTMYTVRNVIVNIERNFY